MKLVVVGGVAGGASVASRVRRLDAKAEIVIFEKGPHVSFSNCSLPYHLSETIKNSSSLVLMSPEAFDRQHDIDVRTLSEVIKIDRENKCVHVLDHSNNKTYVESYDKLVLAPGAEPILPKSIKGIDRDNVYVIRNVVDIEKLKAAIDSEDVENVAVIGGGFIGLEAAENIKLVGKNVTLVEGLNQVMAPFDYDMAQILHKEIDDNGIDLHLNAMLNEIGDKKIIVKENDALVNLPADIVVMAIGVAPSTKLAVDAGLKIGETRGIWVNHNYQTSDLDIYAVGDVIEGYNALMHKAGRLALAGPAQRQARAAADHMYGKNHNEQGFIGSSCIRIFEQNVP